MQRPVFFYSAAGASGIRAGRFCGLSARLRAQTAGAGHPGNWFLLHRNKKGERHIRGAIMKRRGAERALFFLWVPQIKSCAASPFFLSPAPAAAILLPPPPRTAFRWSFFSPYFFAAALFKRIVLCCGTIKKRRKAILGSLPLLVPQRRGQVIEIRHFLLQSNKKQLFCHLVAAFL